MKIVVDTNIIFSSLLKTHTTFGQIIFNADGIFEFYSAQYMRTEIRSHWDKLKRISKLTDLQLEESYYTLLTKISFINEAIIPQKIWEDSEIITDGIDLDDTDFIALTRHLKGKLWTGDKTLRDGLKNKGFKNVLTTTEMLKLWTKKKGQ
ncbi:MAG: PIN domain-containing protein [Bacteroidota bacterium]